MPERVISLHASDVDRATLRTVLAAHLAYDQARAFRILAVPRLLLFAAVVAAIARWTTLLPRPALLVIAGILIATVAGIVAAEVRARIHFRRQIRAFPHGEGFL